MTLSSPLRTASVAVVPAAIAALVLVSPSADAARDAAPHAASGADRVGHQSVHDPARDLVNNRGRHEPASRPGDLTGFTTTYDGRTVTLVSTMRARPVGYALLAWEMKTAHGVYRVDLVHNPHGETGFQFTYRDRPATCGTMTRRSTPHVTTVTVPAACLGHPRWIRTGNVAASRFNLRVGTADDARLVGRVRPNAITVGPRVFR